MERASKATSFMGHGDASFWLYICFYSMDMKKKEIVSEASFFL